MPSLKKLALIGLATALFTGCDKSPDQQVRDKMNEGRVAAATGDESGRGKAQSLLTEAVGISDASSASTAQAHSVLGQVYYETGLEQLRQADRKELAASKIALQIAALGAQLGNSATLVQGYQKLDPKAAKSDIEQKIVEAKGGPDKPKWISDDKVNLMTLSAADQEVSRVQGEIAKRQGEVKDLDAQRVTALEDAEKAMKASEEAKGRESVDAYKQYSDAKKKASDLQAKIELIKGQLVPLEQDLAIAGGQQAILQGAVKEFEEASNTLDTGWKDVQSKIAAQSDLIKQISAGADTSTTQPSEATSAAGKSIAAKATILAQTVKEAEDARQQAADSIGKAVKEFNDAFSKANTAGGEMSEQADKQPQLASVIKIAKEVLAPQIYKLRLATAERVTGDMQMGKAAGLSARIKLRDMLTPLMQQAEQPMPKELADATLDAQLKDAIGAADSSFKDAYDHLTDVIDSGGGDSINTSTKKAAILARIFVGYGQQQLAQMKGDEKGAAEAKAKAIEDVKRAATEMQVTFPTLPGDLAAAIPPPPAPPVAASEPTTAPAEGATAEADSPEVQAIRTVLGSYIAALQKGDTDGAKAFVQIEPGQEDFYNQYSTFLLHSLQFADALKEKFPDQTSAVPGMDVTAQMKAMKIDVKGEEAFSPTLPGQPDKKAFVKADGQWKIYVGAPTPAEQMAMTMMQKIGSVMPTITEDLKAGKYATIQDVQKAMMEAMGPPPPGGATPPAPPQ